MTSEDWASPSDSSDSAPSADELVALLRWDHVTEAVHHGAKASPPKTLMESFADYHELVLGSALLNIYGEQRLIDAIHVLVEEELMRNRQPVDEWNQWEWLPHLISFVTDLSELENGLGVAFVILMDFCTMAFSFIKRAVLGREDLLIVMHDETFLDLCKKAAKLEDWPMLHRWSVEARQIELTGLDVWIHCREVTVDDLLPRSLRFIDETVAKNAKEAVLMMSTKAVGHLLPPELLNMVQDQMLFDYDLPNKTTGNVSGYDAWESVRGMKDWHELITFEPARQRLLRSNMSNFCCDRALLTNRYNRSEGHEGHMVLWSQAEQNYIWYHCIEIDDPDLPKIEQSWVRCGAQPRSEKSATQGDEYLYGFLILLEQCFEHDPEAISKTKHL